jgi:hypothetical protein
VGRRAAGGACKEAKIRSRRWDPYSLCCFNELTAPMRSPSRSVHRRAVGRDTGVCLGALGGDRSGARFASLAQMAPADVGNLVRAWEYHAGDLEARAPAVMARTKSGTTPLLVICLKMSREVEVSTSGSAQRTKADYRKRAYGRCCRVISSACHPLDAAWFGKLSVLPISSSKAEDFRSLGRAPE